MSNPQDNRPAQGNPTNQGNQNANVRPAKQGDPGFDASKDQVIRRNADGTESTVLRNEA